jgi:hypothetical protein
MEKITRSHAFREMTPEMRPQDPMHDAVLPTPRAGSTSAAYRLGNILGASPAGAGASHA